MVRVGNRLYILIMKIAKRHLNAFFIQTYFHEHVLKDGRTDGVLNSSLGDTKAFLKAHQSQVWMDLRSG